MHCRQNRHRFNRLRSPRARHTCIVALWATAVTLMLLATVLGGLLHLGQWALLIGLTALAATVWQACHYTINRLTRNYRLLHDEDVTLDQGRRRLRSVDDAPPPVPDARQEHDDGPRARRRRRPMRRVQ